METPIVFLVFNRPATTLRVFEAIRQARPRKLLVVGDGPRPARPDEAALCAQTQAIVEEVDWPCEVISRFAPANLGCKVNVSTGLDWAFEQVEEAIVLEDDCLPDPSFFPFAEELLRRYRDDSRISQICGSNYQQGHRRTSFSYYFSRHAHIWGWATWRRAWRHHDLTMSRWPELCQGEWLKRYLGDGKAAFYWKKLFDDSHRGDRDGLNSWAIPWTFSNWIRDNLSIIPATNLVANIGYSEESTHTKANGTMNRTLVQSMPFPLLHPLSIEANREADLYTERTFYYGQTLPERLFWSLRLPLSVSSVRRFRRLAGQLSKP